MENDSTRGGQVKPDVDHVICDDAQTHPTFDAWNALVAGPIQPMSPLANADAAFEAGAPLLRLLEPALLLFLLAFPAFGSGEIRSGSKQLLVRFDGQR